jgi:hypothetical protein
VAEGAWNDEFGSGLGEGAGVCVVAIAECQAKGELGGAGGLGGGG